MNTFDIVIVNWNSATQLKECINSIYNTQKKDCQLNKIIVVDNASTDTSLDLLQAFESDTLKIIRNSSNVGFAKACNIGAQYCSSDFILFLNPDMLLFRDTFRNLFNYIDTHSREDVAIYGIQLLDDNKNIQKSCARFPTFLHFINRSLGLNKLNPTLFPSYTMEEWNHKTTQEVDQVMGAFFMIRRDLFVQLKGFDERFFVYYEELDLSKRVNEIGFKTLFISEAQAYHKGGGISQNVKAKRLFYNIRSRLLYAFKHFGLFEASFLMFFTLIIEPLTRSIFLLFRADFHELKEMFEGFILLYKDSINILRQGVQS
jgi:GT2 family glycosyltransferase